MSKRPIRRMLARAFLALTGWKPDGIRPEPRKYVLIAAPHTSNWDFFYLIAFAEYFEIEISWMGKDSLFKPPFGSIMGALGGISVRRDKNENLVVSMARLFDDYEDLGLVVPAEGTRAHVDYWKSGFYHIARTADVPIIMGFLEFKKKRGGFGPAFYPSGDVDQDMDEVRKFYEGKQGRFPELFGRIRLREEDDSTT
jgi:1-acyl-sn-glycerol-3-phosphate acyltransferase